MTSFQNSFIRDFHLWVLWSFKYETEYGVTYLVNVNLVDPCAVVFFTVSMFSGRLTGDISSQDF